MNSSASSFNNFITISCHLQWFQSITNSIKSSSSCWEHWKALEQISNFIYMTEDWNFLIIHATRVPHRAYKISNKSELCLLRFQFSSNSSNWQEMKIYSEIMRCDLILKFHLFSFDIVKSQITHWKQGKENKERFHVFSSNFDYGNLMRQKPLKSAWAEKKNAMGFNKQQSAHHIKRGLMIFQNSSSSHETLINFTSLNAISIRAWNTLWSEFSDDEIKIYVNLSHSFSFICTRAHAITSVNLFNV